MLKEIQKDSEDTKSQPAKISFLIHLQETNNTTERKHQ